MKRTAAAAIVLATALLASAAHAERPAEFQAPRVDEQQAPRNRQEDLQAPRGPEFQAPRAQQFQAPHNQQEDLQAPRGEDVQAPRG